MKSAKYYLLIMITVAIWGSGWPVSKLAVTSTSPTLVTFTRNLLATLAFLILLVFHSGGTDRDKIRDNMKNLILIGLTGVAGYNFLFVNGLKFTTASQGTIIVGIGPAMVILLSSLMKRESIDGNQKFLGVLMSFCGVFFVIGLNVFTNYQADYTKGNLLIVLGVICWAMYSIISKQVTKEISPVVATSISGVIGTSILGIILLFDGSLAQITSQSQNFYFAILWLGFASSFLATLLYNISIQGLGSTRSSIFVNLVPIFGILFSSLILNEAIEVEFFIGLAGILLGILIININYQNAVGWLKRRYYLIGRDLNSGQNLIYAINQDSE